VENTIKEENEKRRKYLLLIPTCIPWTLNRKRLAIDLQCCQILILAIIRSTEFDRRNTVLYPQGVLYTLLRIDVIVIWCIHKTPGYYPLSAILYFQFSIFAPARHTCRAPARYQPGAGRAAGPCATGNSV